MSRIFYILVLISIIALKIDICNAKEPSFSQSVIMPITKGQKLYRYRIPKDFKISSDKAVKISKSLILETKSPLSFPENIDNYFTMVKSSSDPSSYFEYDIKSGVSFICAGFDKYKNEGNTPSLSRGKEAADILKKHLKKLDLLPKPEEIGSIETGSLNMAIRREDGTTDDYEKFTTVTISRKLNGFPVIGASRIVARLTENGQLHSLVYNWVPVDAELLKDNDVTEDVFWNEKIKDVARGHLKHAKDAIVDLVDVVIYDDGKGVFEPAIFVAGKLVTENKEANGEIRTLETGMDYLVPLVKQPAASFPDQRNDAMLPSNPE